MYSPHRDLNFGDTDVPVASLPPDFQACVKSSASGQSSTACDAVVGSKVTGLGYCSQKAYENMTYCGCVNAGVSTPECVFAPCADTPNAYKTTAMQTVLGDPARSCPSSVNCASVRAMGGSGNVASSVSQEPGCYGFFPWIQEHLTTIVLLLILVAIVAVLIGYYFVPEKRRRASGAAATAAKQQAASP
jgi:hypothetical protein